MRWSTLAQAPIASDSSKQTVMSYFSDEVQICFVLVGGGSLIALGIARVRDREDWVSSWIMATKALGVLALAVVAVCERSTFWNSWEANPILAFISLASVVAWLIMRWVFKRKSQDAVLDLKLGADGQQTRREKESLSWMFYWGLLNLALLLTSAILAARA
ncbi:MAG: hypothetical protein M3N93_08385 [Acidobacteriota bacterium]|nr:hypothetical protein [Acidobacteriota bacterium]